MPVESWIPYPYIHTGALVEVKSGPMRGLQGFVESRTGSERIIIPYPDPWARC